jgi:hypothetical protein
MIISINSWETKIKALGGLSMAGEGEIEPDIKVRLFFYQPRNRTPHRKTTKTTAKGASPRVNAPTTEKDAAGTPVV